MVERTNERANERQSSGITVSPTTPPCQPTPTPVASAPASLPPITAGQSQPAPTRPPSRRKGEVGLVETALGRRDGCAEGIRVVVPDVGGPNLLLGFFRVTDLPEH